MGIKVTTLGLSHPLKTCIASTRVGYNLKTQLEYCGCGIFAEQGEQCVEILKIDMHATLLSSNPRNKSDIHVKV